MYLQILTPSRNKRALLGQLKLEKILLRGCVIARRDATSAVALAENFRPFCGTFAG